MDKFIFVGDEFGYIGTTSSILRITHLNSLETETQHIIDFGKLPHKFNIYPNIKLK